MKVSGSMQFLGKLNLYLINVYPLTQARSQDWFWGGAGPPISGPFGPPKVDFLNLTHLNSPAKTSFLAHFVVKSGLFGRFKGCIAPPTPSGYGPALTLTCFQALNQIKYMTTTLYPWFDLIDFLVLGLKNGPFRPLLYPSGPQ